MMMPRKKRKTLIIASIVIFILIIIAILIVLYIKTDMFKSNSTLFAKYIGKNFQNVEIFYDEMGKNEYNELLKENKYTTDTEVKVNYIENMGTTLESTQNPINMLSLKIEEQTDKVNNYNYKDIRLMKNTNKVSEVKYIQNNEVCGLQFSDMFVQYVLANNENLKQIFKQAGFTEEQLAKIPDTIDLDNDVYGLFKFSEEELKDIQTRYIRIVANTVSKGKFSKLKNQNITINETNLVTNGYAVELTKEQLNTIYINLLEELKQDEIILSRLDKLQEMLNEYQIIFSDLGNIREKFVQEIQYSIDDITQSNIGQDACKITVYEANGETVKTTIQGVGYEINIECLFAEEKYMQISYKQTDEAKEKALICRMSDNQLGFVFQNIVGDETSQYTVITSQTVEQNDSLRNTVVQYQDDTNKIEMSIKGKYKIVRSFDDEITLNDENSVNLSNLQQEQVKAVIDRVNTAFTEKLNELQTTVISSDNLTRILIASGLMEEGQSIEKSGVSETEKNRFNSKFEILQGENLANDAIINLINAVKENLIGLEVVSDSQLRLILDRYTNNAEMATILSTFIEGIGDRQYNVAIEYDEQTGLVSDILLTMLPKQ